MILQLITAGAKCEEIPQLKYEYDEFSPKYTNKQEPRPRQYNGQQTIMLFISYTRHTANTIRYVTKKSENL